MGLSRDAHYTVSLQGEQFIFLDHTVTQRVSSRTVNHNLVTDCRIDMLIS